MSLWRATVIAGDQFLDIDSGRDDEYLSAPTQHYTFIFNVLVMMTLFNEVNARKIDGSTNVFSGLHRSRMFIVIWTVTFILQANYLIILHVTDSLSLTIGAEHDQSSRSPGMQTSLKYGGPVQRAQSKVAAATFLEQCLLRHRQPVKNNT